MHVLTSKPFMGQRGIAFIPSVKKTRKNVVWIIQGLYNLEFGKNGQEQSVDIKKNARALGPPQF